MNKHNSHTRRRRGRRLAAAGITSLALLAGASPASAQGNGASGEQVAKAPPSPELAARVKAIHSVEKMLERRLKTNQSVTFDPDHDFYWRAPAGKTVEGLPSASPGNLIRTSAALDGDVLGKKRQFRIIFRDTNPKQPISRRDIDVKVLPEDVIKADSPVTNGSPTPESPWGTVVPFKRHSAVLELNQEPNAQDGFASAELQRVDGNIYTIHVGQSTPTNSPGIVA